MTTVRTSRLICITISAWALYLPWGSQGISQAGDPPHSTTVPVSIPDSTPSGKRDPHCPELLQRLRSSLAKAMDDSTANKLEAMSEARPNALTKVSREARDAVLKKIKVHFYNAQPIEILDSGIGLKTTYVALDKAGAIPAEKAIAGAADQYVTEIEATIRAAETYPARWKELIDVEVQAQWRLEKLKTKQAKIKSDHIQQKQWLKALDEEKVRLFDIPAGQSVEVELPRFNEKGEFQASSHHVKFESVAAAKKAVSDAEAKLRKGIEFDGPHWIDLDVIRNNDVLPVPHSYSFGSTADVEVAIRKLERQLETLKGNYKTEGSYLNTAAGQVVNLKELETIRNVLRSERQNLQSSGKTLADDAQTYFDSQIARIDAIIDPMNTPKDGFAPPRVAFDKVRTKQLLNELKMFPKSIKDDINKPIKSRKQWDNMGGGVLDSTSNGELHQPGLKLETAQDTAPPPITPPVDSGFPGGQASWLSADVGTAGPISTLPSAGSVFSRFKSRRTPLTDRYDTLLGKLGAIDPAIIEAYGQAKPGMALALWRNGKIVTWTGALAGAFYTATPKSWFDALLTIGETSDEAQMKLCASQGAKQVGDLYVNSDPNQNTASDQSFQDCSIAFIKTKFVKDYMGELSKDDSTVETRKDADLIEIDPRKVATSRTKGKFFKNKKTGEIYVRPDLTSVAFAQQPGVSFDPKLQLMKINIDKIPVTGSDGPQHIVEKNPENGNLVFHVDRLASSDSGLYSLNNNHEIVLSPRISTYVDKLLQKRRKIMGYRNNQSNVESVLRQFFSNANPCSDPYYTRWITAKSPDEYKKGFLSCVRFLYPGFMRLGDTEALVNQLLDANPDKQSDLLKPLVTMDATFGNYVCSLLSWRSTVADPTGTANVTSPLICQNLSTYAGASNTGWPLGTPPWGNGVPGAWNPGGGWGTVPQPATNGAAAPATSGVPSGGTPPAPQAAPAPQNQGAPTYIPGLSGPPTPNMTPSQFFY
ncbi:MAG: hypothetical protein ACJ763_00395 [Bdellovibrionia bacterium]